MSKKGKKQTDPSHHQRKVEKLDQTVNNTQRSWKPALIAIAVTCLCFLPSLNNEFVNWDDDKNFYENPLIQNVTSDNFWATTKEIFSSGVIGNYNPLSIWTFAIEKVWFGFDQPFNWHLDNLLLHLIAVFLIYRIVIFLGVGWRGALLAALLFGIHPMRVESVAWVTERKDVLFGVFYLGALLQYIKYKSDHKKIRWLWMTLLFVLSLFSKIQAVSLPLSMLAVDYYLDKQMYWKELVNAIIRKLPFFVLSLLFGILGIKFLHSYGSLATVDDQTHFNFIQRLFLGAYSFGIYIIKAIIPFRMSPLYPYPHEFPWYFYTSFVVVALVLGLLWWAYKKDKKPVFFGMMFFIVNIIFLLQILGAGQGFLADRFTYIAYFGLFFIPAYYLDDLWAKKPQKTTILAVIVGAFLLMYAVMTFQQCKVWQNSGTLWSHVLKYYQNTTLPYGNRANYYRDQKMYKAALADYAAALKLKDQQPQTYNSRARLYFDVAKDRDTLLLALADYNKAIEYKSDDGEFFVNRGATYARLGELDKALDDMTRGLELKPDHAVGYLNRSIMYQQIGKLDLALNDIKSYLELNPGNGDLWYEKGNVLNKLGRHEEAIAAFNEALIRKNSNPGLIYYQRSQTHHFLKHMNEAKADLQKSIELGFGKIDPNYRKQLGL